METYEQPLKLILKEVKLAKKLIKIHNTVQTNKYRKINTHKL